MPCGMGNEAAFAFTLSLADWRNVASLRVERLEAKGRDVGDSVRIVFRPDIEWRSFHATTKAYQGLDSLFPSKTVPSAASPTGEVTGFEFSPYDGTFRMSVVGGA